MPVQHIRFESGKPGVRLVVFGAIHGNERCGPQAIERVVKRIRSGGLSLSSGSVLFVPVCNPEAYARNARFFEENLNRVFRKTDNPASYEARCANALCDLLEKEADMLLDIHSTSAPGPMSVFTDHPSEEADAFARALGPAYVILDWPVVYANDPLGFRSQCTSDFAHEIGIPNVTVECGQHDDPASVDIAEAAIMRAMAFAKVVGTPQGSFPQPRRIRMRTLLKKDSDADLFSDTWEHLELIPSGTVIATRADGAVIRAEEDSVMLLPKHHAKAGEEWFYLGTLA